MEGGPLLRVLARPLVPNMQAGASQVQLEREAAELRSQAALSSQLESQNAELAARLAAAEAATASARAGELAARKAAEVAGRQLEQKTSQRETELQGSLKRASKELREVTARCERADQALAAAQADLAEARSAMVAQTRQKNAAEVAAVVGLSCLVLGGAAAAAMYRSS